MKKLFLCSSKNKITLGQIVKDGNGFAMPIENIDLESLNESDMYRVIGSADDCSIYVVPATEEDDCQTSEQSVISQVDTNPPVRQRITKDPDVLRLISNELSERRKQRATAKIYTALIKGNENVLEGDRIRRMAVNSINGIIICALDAFGDYEVVEVIQHISKPIIAKLVKIQIWNTAERGGHYINQQNLRAGDTSWADDYLNIKFVLEDDD